MWLSPNGVSCGYISNIDYNVVPPLTLMGCYNDLKWFNGSQVGAPNGPLYTSVRIMNGNDSVVKCLCFFGFLFSPLSCSLFLSSCSGSVTGINCVVIGLQTVLWVSGWLKDSFCTRGAITGSLKVLLLIHSCAPDHILNSLFILCAIFMIYTD